VSGSGILSLNQLITVLLSRYFRLLDLGGLGFFGCTFKVQRQQQFQKLLVGEIGWPAVSGGNGGIEFLVCDVQPCRAFVVKIRERTLLKLSICGQNQPGSCG